MLLPRHYRRVTLAARRCGRLDAIKGVSLMPDYQWCVSWLKQVRRDAVTSGELLDDVNLWTMAGLIDGRNGRDK